MGHGGDLAHPACGVVGNGLAQQTGDVAGGVGDDVDAGLGGGPVAAGGHGAGVAGG